MCMCMCVYAWTFYEKSVFSKVYSFSPRWDSSFKTGNPTPSFTQYEKSKWFFFFQNAKQDFPGGPMVKKLAANAGDTGLIPGLGRSHMPLSLSCNCWAHGPKVCLPQQEKPPQWEAHALQLEKALAQQQRSSTVKNKILKNATKQTDADGKSDILSWETDLLKMYRWHPLYIFANADSPSAYLLFMALEEIFPKQV